MERVVRWISKGGGGRLNPDPSFRFPLIRLAGIPSGGKEEKVLPDKAKHDKMSIKRTDFIYKRKTFQYLSKTFKSLNSGSSAAEKARALLSPWS